MQRLLQKVLPSFLYETLRRLHTYREQKKFEKLPPLTLPEIEKFLVNDLGVRPDDTLFIHANFSILKLESKPQDLIQLLIRLVGPKGNLLMPFYPIKKSYDALRDGKPFDLRQNRTSMGALSIALAQTPGAKKSLHPTKSVVVWGKDRDFLINDHAKSPLPYSDKSPYGRACQLPQSKILGLGVGDYIASVQVAVDKDESYPIQPYHPEPLVGVVIDYEGKEHHVTTYAHDYAVTSHENVPRFLNSTQCPTYREVFLKDRPFYIVDMNALVNHVWLQGKKGVTFFYPNTLNHKQPRRKTIST